MFNPKHWKISAGTFGVRTALRNLHRKAVQSSLLMETACHAASAKGGGFDELAQSRIQSHSRARVSPLTADNLAALEPRRGRQDPQGLPSPLSLLGLSSAVYKRSAVTQPSRQTCGTKAVRTARMR